MSVGLFEWMVAYVRERGQAPTAEEIRQAANFGEPGGVGRLCATLEVVGVVMASAKRAREA